MTASQKDLLASIDEELADMDGMVKRVSALLKLVKCYTLLSKSKVPFLSLLHALSYACHVQCLLHQGIVTHVAAQRPPLLCVSTAVQVAASNHGLMLGVTTHRVCP